jgi:hypothetical protein
LTRQRSEKSSSEKFSMVTPGFAEVFRSRRAGWPPRLSGAQKNR